MEITKMGDLVKRAKAWMKPGESESDVEEAYAIVANLAAFDGAMVEGMPEPKEGNKYVVSDMSYDGKQFRVSVVAIQPEPAKQNPQAESVFGTYDAGLLNDNGGGDVNWWWNYIRSELGRAHEFYADQLGPLATENAALKEENERLKGIEQVAKSYELQLENVKKERDKCWYKYHEERACHHTTARERDAFSERLRRQLESFKDAVPVRGLPPLEGELEGAEVFALAICLPGDSIYDLSTGKWRPAKGGEHGCREPLIARPVQPPLPKCRCGGEAEMERSRTGGYRIICHAADPIGRNCGAETPDFDTPAEADACWKRMQAEGGKQ